MKIDDMTPAERAILKEEGTRMVKLLRPKNRDIADLILDGANNSIATDHIDRMAHRAASLMVSLGMLTRAVIVGEEDMMDEETEMLMVTSIRRAFRQARKGIGLEDKQFN